MTNLWLQIVQISCVLQIGHSFSTSLPLRLLNLFYFFLLKSALTILAHY